MSTPASLALSECAVPRYTSYPTAPHFSDRIDESQARDWLAALPRDAALSLYLHVPFCPSLCAYCGCHTKAVKQDAPVAAYAETLAREIALVAEATPARRVALLHWGGGTPSLLGPKRFLSLVGALRQRFDFASDVEHAIELDPRLVDAPLVAALAAAGVTRVSFGVQDFNPHVQESIGRVQPFEVVEVATRLIRGAGIEAINFDLMYGLPEQTTPDVIATAQLAASLKPSRLAVFGYAHVPWFAARQKLVNPLRLPGAAERLEQAAAARETLEREGYAAIGLDHFARPDDALAVAARQGRLRRNFQGYTVDPADALLPFGASAIGRLPQGYFGNAPDLGGWRRAIEAGRLATVRGLAFTPDDVLRGEAIERLMCDFALDFGALCEAQGLAADTLDAALPRLETLAEEGLITLAGRRIMVTKRGRPFVRLAAAAFDAWLHANAARHSVAV
jgi:oxygen-independent coproporphyrinogen III oxidase